MSRSEIAGRLRALRDQDRVATASLWIEALPPEEALEELRTREGPLFRLQEARFLTELGRADDAVHVLSALGELPPGLEALRTRLLTATERALFEASQVQGLDEGDVRCTLGSSEAALVEWLRRVEGWRRVLHA